MIPPILLRLKYIGEPFYGIKGEFSSWQEAEDTLQRDGLQDYAADMPVKDSFFRQRTLISKGFLLERR